MKPLNPEQALRETRREFGEHGGITPSIARSSTFTVMDPATMPEIFQGIRGPDKGGCFLYSRHFNLTVDVLARYMSAIEGTEFAVCTTSGMSAITCTLLQLCRGGDHIVSSDTIYGGTHALLQKLLPEMGAPVTYPGLPSHPQNDLIKSMINPTYGYGGLLTIDCGTKEKAEELMSILQKKERFGFIAVSLGFYDTLMFCSGSSTSSEIPPEDQSKIGLSPGLVRIAIGYTGSLEARLEQIERAVRLVGLAS